MSDVKVLREALVASQTDIGLTGIAALGAFAALDRIEAHNERLLDGINWAYQALGARWPDVHALDNLSALAQGLGAPHEWPVWTPDPLPAEDGVNRASDLPPVVKACGIANPAQTTECECRKALEARHE